MGGNAFPEFKDRYIRLDAEQFAEFQDEILEKLRTMNGHIPKAIFSDILSYNAKPSFGDLDILYSQFLENREVPTPDEFKETLNAVAMVKNGPVISYAVPYDVDFIFQVDLIKVKFDEFDAAYSYFAYNDLGNLIGRIFHRAGFKLGHNGMSFLIRDANRNYNHVLKEVVVTTSWQEALEFAGYDYSKWLEGFDTLEDVFEYAVSSPLANRVIFRLEETNHQARVRDRKRKTYQEFLKWVNRQDSKVPDKEEISKNDLRIQWLIKAFEKFPKFKEEYETAQNLLQKSRAARDKFNGTLISQITGLNGKELGEFIADFVQKFIVGINKSTREDWAISHSIEEIEESIRNWHQYTYGNKSISNPKIWGG